MSLRFAINYDAALLKNDVIYLPHGNVMVVSLGGFNIENGVLVFQSK